VYNEDIAKDYLYASAFAYCPADRQESGDCKAAGAAMERLGMKSVFAIDNGRIGDPITMTIMERRKDKEIIVAFSGTKGIEELVDEIVEGLPVDYDLHPSQGSKVLGYFYHSYKDEFRTSFIKKIKTMADSWHDSGYRIIFTGHSLGGAIALHAAADAILEGIFKKHQVYIYTYGLPRVGNIEFLNQFINQCAEFYRVVHNRDLVSHVPPCITDLSGGCLKTGFLPLYPHQPPTEIWYTEDMTSYTLCSKTEGEDRSCSNKVYHESYEDHIYYFGIEIGQFHNYESEELALKDSALKTLKISK
jgi:hypothetical protein